MPSISTPYANFLNIKNAFVLLGLLESGCKQGPRSTFSCHLPSVSSNTEHAYSFCFVMPLTLEGTGPNDLQNVCILDLSVCLLQCLCLSIPCISYNLKGSPKGVLGFRFNFLWQEYSIGDIRASLKQEPCTSHYLTAILLFLTFTLNSGSRDCQPGYPDPTPSNCSSNGFNQ